MRGTTALVTATRAPTTTEAAPLAWTAGLPVCDHYLDAGDRVDSARATADGRAPLPRVGDPGVPMDETGVAHA
jgi:hypothetical protein